MLGCHRNHHRRKLRTLRLVNRDRVGQRQLIQLAKIVVHLAPVKIDKRLPFLGVDLRDVSDVAVERVLVVVVAGLDHPVANLKAGAKLLHEGHVRSRRIQRFLQSDVQLAHAQQAPMHRAQHLHILDRVQPELRRDALLDQVQQGRQGLLRILAFDKKEIRIRRVRLGKLAAVDPVRVGDDPAARRLAKHLGQPRDRNQPALDQMPEDPTRPDRWQLIHIADQQ